MTDRWVDVAASSALADNTAIEVVAGKRILAVFRSDGNLFAMDGMCVLTKVARSPKEKSSMVV